MVTGVNPGKHGIFDFRVGDELLMASDKKVRELWDDIPSVVINVPMTYPVKEIDGVMITGMMSPDLDSAMVFPENERAYLKSIDYQIEAEQTLDSIRSSIQKRMEMIQRYIEYDWELFFVVFRELDVVHHFFWGKDLEFYQMIDQFLGDFLLPKLSELNAKLMIVSDHGFTKVDQAINVGKLIEQFGYADLYQVGGWGALYKVSEFSDDLRDQMIEQFQNFTVNGKQVLNVYRNEEIYWGPYAEQGPDLLIWPRRELGYTFAMRSETAVVPSEHKNGCHLEHGVVVLQGFESTLSISYVQPED